jgi:serine/threonine-protein kinase
MSLEIGSRIGDYEIVSVLGAGGMGKVYKVRNVISDRIEAMKVLLPDLEHEPELADRFMREIKVQASLQHPNIAALHTALRVGNQLLMIMELVEGVTLDVRLQRGPIPVHEGVDYILQVLSALGYAHERGVIHRDIKPANMMLTANKVVKLMDFGIAKAAADRKLTVTGTTMGSLYYMSPEQIKGMPNLDARSDLYSVGVSLYEIVTGRKPFDGDSQFAIMAAHLEKTPVPPIKLDERLPQMLNDVVLMSIVKDPDQRFQSAQAFAAALGNVRQGLGMPIQSPAAGSVPTATMRAQQVPAPPAVMTGIPTSAPASAQASKSGKRWLWAAAGALATIVALVAVIQFGPWRKNNAQASPQLVPDSPPATAPLSQPVAASPATAAVDTAPAQTLPPAETHATQPAAAGPKSRGGSARPPRVERQAAQTPVSGLPAAPQTPPTAAEQASQAPLTSEGSNTAVLQELRERLVDVAARTGTVRNSLANLKRSQAESGLSLRGDMATAENRMNYLLDGANSALTARDAPAAKKFIDSAEAEVEKLEKFLGL